jgi:hypothetical protein
LSENQILNPNQKITKFNQSNKIIMPNIILNEQAQSEVQEVLNSLPISELPKVQKLVAIFNASVEKPKEDGND